MPQYFLDYERVGHHKSMISDKLRTQSFKKAIKKLVSTNDIVVDIGAGIGILSFFAAKSGAKKVYAIERTDIINIAKNLAKKNNINNMIFIKKDSDNVKLAEKCDILVSECIGYFALQENMISDVLRFRKKYLKKNGKIIPKKIELFIMPISSRKAYNEIDFWNIKYNLNFLPIRDIAVNSTYHMNISTNDMLGKPILIKQIDLVNDKSVSLNEKAVLKINKSGTLHGLAGFFNVYLTDDIVLSNVPENNTHWKTQFFPIKYPVKVKNEDIIKVKIKAKLQKAFVDWEWKVDVNNHKFHQNTLKGIRIKER